MTNLVASVAEEIVIIEGMYLLYNLEYQLLENIQLLMMFYTFSKIKHLVNYI